MVQLIEKHFKSYKLLINNIQCTFITMELFIKNNLFPEHRNVHKHKGYLFWIIGKKQISYNQIKKAIKNN